MRIFRHPAFADFFAQRRQTFAHIYRSRSRSRSRVELCAAVLVLYADDLHLYATALHLEKRGVKYFNIEQDLGIDGLRKWKTSYQPVFFLKKYKITPKSLVD